MCPPLLLDFMSIKSQQVFSLEFDEKTQQKIEQKKLNKNAASTLTIFNINFLIGISDVFPAP